MGNASKLKAFGIIGGKYNMVEDILDVLPQTMVYCEPFGGSGVVLLNKPISKIEVFNDKDDLIVNFFRVLRENADELMSRLSLSPYSRKEYIDAIETVQNESDPVEKARKFFIIVESTIFNLSNFKKSNWRPPYIKKFDDLRNRASEFKIRVEKLVDVIERLRLVHLEYRSAIDVIKLYDTEWTTFYCDPPYPFESRSTRNLYRFEMSDEEHVALANVLKQCKGYVLLSTYENELYDELYSDWTKLTKQVHVCSSKRSRQAVEVLYANYVPVIKKSKLTIEHLCKNNRQVPSQEDTPDW